MQGERVCLCIYVCMCVCVFACARQWLRGMEGIPCSLLRRRKDFGGGERVSGLGVTVKARRKRRNKFYTISTFHTCNVCANVSIVALLHGYQEPVFVVGNKSNRDK